VEVCRWNLFFLRGDYQDDCAPVETKESTYSGRRREWKRGSSPVQRNLSKPSAVTSISGASLESN
jgi:hypothetical protein